MSKNIFLRKDWQTYKPKFKLLCPYCEFSIQKVAGEIDKSYISKVITIKEKIL